MKLLICLSIVVAISLVFSSFIKKNSIYLYIVSSVISMVLISYTILALNGYIVTYIIGVKELMRYIDSGTLGGSIFILVMYIGVLDRKNNLVKKLSINRAELSILGSIFIIPHNIHYFFNFLLNLGNIIKSTGIPLWTNLIMFSAGVFAIGIMIPLFVTSFMKIRKKMNAKKWKSLQEYAYIFYAMIFVQVIMVYIGKPTSMDRTISLIGYSFIFITYSIFKFKMVMDKRRQLSLSIKKN